MRDKYDYVMRRLDKQSGHLSEVARECGISRRALSYIHAGTYKPRMDTLDRLFNYLKEKEAKK